MSHCNFFEVLVLKQEEGVDFSDPNLQKDLQHILDLFKALNGVIDARFRRRVGNSEEILLVLCFRTIEEHDDFDIRGETLKILKILFSRVVPTAAYFLYMDSSMVDSDPLVWNVDAFHVKTEEKGTFEKEVNAASGLMGAWYASKKIPPLPKVMPVDLGELEMIKEGQKRAEARLSQPVPNIWLSFSTPFSHGNVDEFGRRVEKIVHNVVSGSYERFLDS